MNNAKIIKYEYDPEAEVKAAIEKSGLTPLQHVVAMVELALNGSYGALVPDWWLEIDEHRSNVENVALQLEHELAAAFELYRLRAQEGK